MMPVLDVSLKQHLLQSHDLVMVFPAQYIEPLSKIIFATQSVQKYSTSAQIIKTHNSSVLHWLKLKAQDEGDADKIIDVYFHGVHDKFGYIVMEYIEGGCLRDIWKQMFHRKNVGNKQSKTTKQVTIIKQIARIISQQLLDILVFLQHHGIIHRDLKLENILVTKQYKLKLIDFATVQVDRKNGDEIRNYQPAGSKISGLEDSKNQSLFQQNSKQHKQPNKQLDHGNLSQINKYRSAIMEMDNKLNAKNQYLVGSKHYIPPELISGNRNRVISTKIDVWAFGVIFYWLLTGFFPFDIEDKQKLTNAIYKKIRESQPNYSNELEQQQIEVLRSCFAKNPSVRPSASQLRRLKYFSKKIQIKQSDSKVDLIKIKLQQYSQPIVAEQLWRVKFYKRVKLTKILKQYTQEKVPFFQPIRYSGKCQNQIEQQQDIQYQSNSNLSVCQKQQQSQQQQHQPKTKPRGKYKQINLKLVASQNFFTFQMLEKPQSLQKPFEKQITSQQKNSPSQKYKISKNSIKIEKQNIKQIKIQSNQQGKTIQLYLLFQQSSQLDQFICMLMPRV